MTDVSRKSDRNDLGISDVVSAAEKLFYEFGTALSYCQSAESAVTGVTVAAENHFSCARKLFTHISMYDCHVCGNVNTAVLSCGGQAEYVVVFVYRASHGAQRVVTVRQHVRQRKTFKTACFRALNNSHVSDVVRSDGVETNMNWLALISARNAVSGQYRISHRAFEGLGNFLVRKRLSYFADAFEFTFVQIRSAFSDVNHRDLLYYAFLFDYTTQTAFFKMI